MPLSDLMDEARKEQGYPDLPTNWNKWIEQYSTDSDKVLLFNEDGFLAGQFTDQYILMDGANIAIEVSWYVTPEKRNIGIGMDLYNQFYKLAYERGCDYILQGRSTGKDCTKVGPFYLRKID